MKRILVAALLSGSLTTLVHAGGDGAGETISRAMLPEEGDETRVSTADHTKFEALQRPFKSGPEVTKVCLSCHTEAARHLMATIHWTWECPKAKKVGKEAGKAYVINNFCIGVQSNQRRCTSCHTGYGWDHRPFDFSDETKVDCLVCHDTTGTYKKFPPAAGKVMTEPMARKLHETKVLKAYKKKQADMKQRGEVLPDLTPEALERLVDESWREQPYAVFPPDKWEAARTDKGKKFRWYPIDLQRVAMNVGPTSRATCGACHFKGGGGDGVKHGDLDTSLIAPDRSLDVHMDANGLNFSCSKCHTTHAHQIDGRCYEVPAATKEGFALPNDDEKRITCSSCHGLSPHKGKPIMDEHTRRVACQTCHVPAFARKNPTKMSWDWSKAGQFEQGHGLVVMDEATNRLRYHYKKGAFVWKKNVQPQYFWWRGSLRSKTLDDPIDPTHPVEMNTIVGSPDDGVSKIAPFKVHEGVQPYDKMTNKLVLPHLMPYDGTDATALWGKNLKPGVDMAAHWKTAIAEGMKYVNKPFSGEVGWIHTRMYWPITHMVAPKGDAVSCAECHVRTNGRLAKVAGIYLPGRDINSTSDLVGWLLVVLTLIGAVVHGLARVVLGKRNKGIPSMEGGD